MTHQNMTTSTRGLAKLIKVSDQTCDKHGSNLIFLSSSPEKLTCYECSKESVAAETEQMADEAYETYLKRDTYNWLQNKSIIVEKKILKATFDNYKVIDKETETNKQLALEFAREYYKGATYNTIFSGKAGTGKSHLAMAILKAVNENSKPYKKCLFVSIGEVVSLVQDSFRNKESEFTQQSMTDLLVEADLLVLDDIGAEIGSMDSEKTVSDFVAKIIKKVLDGRDEKATIITTNLTSDQLREKYDDRIFSRMNKGVLGEEKHSIKFKDTTDKRLYSDF